MKKIATFISTLGHPLLTIPLFIVIVLFGNEDSSRAAPISFLIIGCVFIPVTIRLYIKSRNGSYTNFDVSDKIQRRSLYLFVVPLLLIVTIILFATNQSRNLCLGVLFALLLLILSQAINYFVKSSLHVSLNIYLTALIFTVNFKAGVAALLFTALISWSRVKLGRHSVKEVLFGLLIGTIISLILLKLEGYINL